MPKHQRILRFLESEHDGLSPLLILLCTSFARLISEIMRPLRWSAPRPLTIPLGGIRQLMED